jgi:hypothetical protein
MEIEHMLTAISHALGIFELICMLKFNPDECDNICLKRRKSGNKKKNESLFLFWLQG